MGLSESISGRSFFDYDDRDGDGGEARHTCLALKFVIGVPPNAMGLKEAKRADDR